jgi:hypothetical protein
VSAPDPAREEALATARAAMRRSRVQGRRWFLRAVLMAVIAGVAFYRGGELNLAIGGAMALLAVLSFSLGRGARGDAARLLEKLRAEEQAR